ncbi:NAD(P)-binding protein [Xylariomycetidae sp. FL0641]|nr:NAD(P)-binding protein [Xylariomycetidae sp. FL0641]
MVNFDPATDIPDLSGKVVLVTGANSGLGESTLAALAAHNPAKAYLGARSRRKAEEALARIRAKLPDRARDVDIQILDLDLGSVESVKAAAARVNAEVDRLDILQLNAGVGMIPQQQTVDGYEVHFGTNYFGHALLTRLLLPTLLRTAQLPGAPSVRVVSMTSVAHKNALTRAPGIRWELLRGNDGSGAAGGDGGLQPPNLYGQANLAKVLLARGLARRYPALLASAVHPGTVATPIWTGPKQFASYPLVGALARRLVIDPLVWWFGVDSDEGAKNQLWLSVADGVENGGYYEPVGVRAEASRFATDEMTDRLWEWTDKEFERHGVDPWPAAS